MNAKTMHVELTCGCGSSITLEGTALLNDGNKTREGWIYLVEKMAHEWQAEHKGCTARHRQQGGK